MQPQSQTVADGQSVTFGLSVNGSGSAPFSFQWSRDGQPIAGATSPTFTIAAVTLADSGARFTVAVGNAAGTTTSAAATLTVTPVAPSIVADAAHTISVMSGQPATFSVTVAGSLPMTFQWRRNGAPIAGATTSTITTAPTTGADDGAVFDVVVTNVAGAVTSTPFTLSVVVVPATPSIAAQPQAASVRVGESATFSVTPGGTAPFAFQWQRDGQPIAGAQTASLTLPNLAIRDSDAQFSVVVTNAAGAITSASALLVVRPQPGLALLAGDIGGNGTIDALATAARFTHPEGVVLDSAGNAYVTEGTTIRRIAPSGQVTTIAGDPNNAAVLEGSLANARFALAGAITIDAAGNLYVFDSGEIRKVSLTAGTVSRFAGSSVFTGSTDGPSPLFGSRAALAADAQGNIYVADADNHTIRKVDPTGTASTIAGTAGQHGTTDGPAASALFFRPGGVAVAANGDLLIVDSGNGLIRVLDTSGTVSTLAGSTSGTGSSNDGQGAAAQFAGPGGGTLDAAGNLYVGDAPAPGFIRKITPTGLVTTIAGNLAPGFVDGSVAAARFGGTSGIASDASGALVIVDFGNLAVRRLSTTGIVSTAAGAPALSGIADGTGPAARFSTPAAVAVDAAHNVYVADSANHTIRKSTPEGVVSTLAGVPGTFGFADGPGSQAMFFFPGGLAVDAGGTVYVADATNNVIRKITPAGVVSTFAGSSSGFGFQDGQGSAARFNAPGDLVLDAAGNVYVTDANNHAVRKITPTGLVTTLAGSASQVGDADGTGAAAEFGRPTRVAIDASGNLYVTDTTFHEIRKITPAGVTTKVGGFGTAGLVLVNPVGLAIEPGGTLLISDPGAATLRRLDFTTNSLSTPAGVADQRIGVLLGAFPGHLASPQGIAVDRDGNAYVTDQNGVLRVTFQ